MVGPLLTAIIIRFGAAEALIIETNQRCDERSKTTRGSVVKPVPRTEPKKTSVVTSRAPSQAPLLLKVLTLPLMTISI